MAIRIKNLHKSLNAGPLYRNLSFEAKHGKITAIFGPNGSGKSTLFNILAGVTAKDGGEATIVNFDPKRFGYLFQNYRETLLPWRTNKSNLSLPLESRDCSKSEIDAHIADFQNTFGLTIPLDRYPYELSGGQQQMLSFFRTLITNPSTLLIDEPFSALDYQNWTKFCDLLQRYHAKYSPTILAITHNIEEAIYLADEIVIFSDKPTHVVAVIPNPLPRPRTIETLRSPEFHTLKSHVLKVFHGAVAA